MTRIVRSSSSGRVAWLVLKPHCCHEHYCNRFVKKPKQFPPTHLPGIPPNSNAHAPNPNTTHTYTAHGLTQTTGSPNSKLNTKIVHPEPQPRSPKIPFAPVQEVAGTTARYKSWARSFVGSFWASFRALFLASFCLLCDCCWIQF